MLHLPRKTQSRDTSQTHFLQIHRNGINAIAQTASEDGEPDTHREPFATHSGNQKYQKWMYHHIEVEDIQSKYARAGGGLAGPRDAGSHTLIPEGTDCPPSPLSTSQTTPVG